MTPNLSRRDFVAAAGAAAALACTPGVRAQSASRPSSHSAPPVDAIVLFQGDSITDVNRDRSTTVPNSAAALGAGYPNLLAAALLQAYPDSNLHVFNRGVSGNTVPDLTARWDADTLGLQPTVLSLLIGVNDFWHKRTRGYTGTVADYETQYGDLLDATRRRLPGARLVVMEPFVLRTGAVDQTWFPEFDERRTAAARVARRLGATFVPLQVPLDRAAAHGGPAYWLADGVHPTPAGHALLAEQWRAAVGW
jgi:lysophospholipase L1-like esterase